MERASTGTRIERVYLANANYLSMRTTAVRVASSVTNEFTVDPG